MKKYIIIALILILTIINAGCNKEKEPQPEDQFSAYVELWNDQKFDQMYEYLSSEAKDTISQEDFTSRYTKIYEDLGIHDLSIQFNKPDELADTKEIEEIEFPFSVKMESIAGEIAFDHQAILVKEEREEDESNWYLNWDTTFIFPDLEEGDTIGLSTVSALRGEIVDRNGEELAFTGRAYEIGIVPGKMEGPRKSHHRKGSRLIGHKHRTN